MQMVTDRQRVGGMPCKLFFEHRVIPDITHAYYAIRRLERDRLRRSGQSRGYVRMGGPARSMGSRRSHPGEEAIARRKNHRVG